MLSKFTGPPDEWFTILDRMENGSAVFNRSAVQSVRDETIAVFNGFTDHFGPVTAFKFCRRSLPGDAILTVDVGSHLHLAGQYWNTSGKQNIINDKRMVGNGIWIACCACSQN